VIEAFEEPSMAYRALRHPKYKLRFGVYDHLARVAEWGLGDEEADADAGGSEP
jgi:ATP-dependent helicase/nuclease subunit B